MSGVDEGGVQASLVMSVLLLLLLVELPNSTFASNTSSFIFVGAEGTVGAE